MVVSVGVMSTGSHEFGTSRPGAVTVSFGERFAQSDQFDAVFQEGMALVERTAAYLDGQGRKDAKTLKSPLTVIYATESMRLTTRLLDLASWLLIRRGVRDGEMTVEEARRRRSRVKLKPFSRPSHIKDYSELPEGLRGLIEASFALNDRIVQLDRAIEGGAQPGEYLPPAENPVAVQLAQLRTAFAR